MRTAYPHGRECGDRTDCLIVGAGPAGLTAAIYAARFLLSVSVIDGGASRAALIPCTRNHAGFPDGISGAELLSRMRRQAVRFGARVIPGEVTEIAAGPHGFTASGPFGVLDARTVLLATGVTNRRPDIAPDLHAAALREGRIRYCPVCDGYEAIDQRIGVIGTGERGVREAAFLRAYSSDVTLVAHDGPHALSPGDHDRLRRLDVVVVDGPARGLALAAQGIALSAGRERLQFDCVYPALGSDVHSSLGVALGAAVSDDGCLRVDAQQRTTIAGLYAAGDVVLGLDQISHAIGEAGVAATTIRNDLAAHAEIMRGT